MPYLVVFTRWPSDKVPEVVKKSIEVTRKFPEDTSLGEAIVPNAIKGSMEGMRTLSVTEVKKGKLEDAIDRAVAMLVMYQSVEGFEYSLEIWRTVEEAYAAIGQKPPE